MHRLLLILVLCSLMMAGCGQGREEQQAVPPQSAEGTAIASTQQAAPTVDASPSAMLADNALPSADDSGVTASGTAAAEKNNAGMIPAEIAIPAIGVKAKVISLGLTKDGAMDVPKTDDEVGWFKPGYRPGVPGHAVLAGHVDSKTGPAIFFKLKQLKKGSKIILKSKDGGEKVFRVIDTKTYPYDKAPLEKIFGPSKEPLLNLITCTGLYSRSKGTHQERLVVTAELAV